MSVSREQAWENFWNGAAGILAEVELLKETYPELTPEDVKRVDKAIRGCSAGLRSARSELNAVTELLQAYELGPQQEAVVRGLNRARSCLSELRGTWAEVAKAVKPTKKVGAT